MEISTVLTLMVVCFILGVLFTANVLGEDPKAEAQK